ncbi:MAG: hypothetical protein ACOC1F_11160, partial [Myxococcota bacterium]
GAQLGQVDEGDTLTLTSSDGSEFAHGVVFEVIATPSAPSSVTEGGAEVAAVGSLSELEESASGWLHVPDERGGTLYVKVPAGEREVTVR